MGPAHMFNLNKKNIGASQSGMSRPCLGFFSSGAGQHKARRTIFQ